MYTYLRTARMAPCWQPPDDVALRLAGVDAFPHDPLSPPAHRSAHPCPAAAERLASLVVNAWHLRSTPHVNYDCPPAPAAEAAHPSPLLWAAWGLLRGGSVVDKATAGARAREGGA